MPENTRKNFFNKITIYCRDAYLRLSFFILFFALFFISYSPHPIRVSYIYLPFNGNFWMYCCV